MLIYKSEYLPKFDMDSNSVRTGKAIFIVGLPAGFLSVPIFNKYRINHAPIVANPTIGFFML